MSSEDTDDPWSDDAADRPTDTRPAPGWPRCLAEVVVTNHVMGLYELAAIHLAPTPPDLARGRAGDRRRRLPGRGARRPARADADHVRDALANIRLAFVQIKDATAPTEPTRPAARRDPCPSRTVDALGPQQLRLLALVAGHQPADAS